MKAQYTSDGKIQLNLAELLDCISAEDKIDLIQQLSCEDAIIKHVMDQVLNGWTENCSHGARMNGRGEPNTPLEKARREVAKMAGEVSKKEIEALEDTLKREKEQYKKATTWVWKMYHAWPKEYLHQRP